MSRYRINNSATYSLKYHIIWCTKYRRKVILDKVEQRLKKLLYEKAAKIGVKIHTLESMPDHVHLFIESDPSWAIAGIEHALKGYTSRILRKEFPKLKATMCSLWSRSYYVDSIGSVSEEAIKHYIESQKGK